MQPHDDNQRPEEGHPDGGRNAEQDAILDAIRVAHAKIFNVVYRPVHIAEEGKPVNMGASLTGTGGLDA